MKWTANLCLMNAEVFMNPLTPTPAILKTLICSENRRKHSRHYTGLNKKP